MSLYMIKRHLDSVPEELLCLLQGYPFKRYSGKVLDIDQNLLAKYQYDSYCRSGLKNGAFFTLEDGGEVAGCFALSRHNWHSELFGVEFYRISHFLLRQWSEEGCRELAAAVREAGQQLGAEVIGLRVDCKDRLSLNALARQGFDIVGHSVKMVLTKPKLDRALGQNYTSTDNGAAGVCIRPVEETDQDALKRIAAESHQCSHYFNDSRLKSEAVRRLFPEWVGRCCRGAAAAVLVAEAENKPVGFVTLLVNERLAEYTGQRAGVVDFIAVSPEVQGRGMGRLLLAHALRWLAERSDYVEVRTEWSNFRAVRFYQKAEMEMVSGDVDLHCWLE